MFAISYIAVCRHVVLVGVCMHGVLKQHTRMLSYSSLYAWCVKATHMHVVLKMCMHTVLTYVYMQIVLTACLIVQ